MLLKAFVKQIRSNIIAGILLLIPLVLSIVILVKLFQWVDSALPGIIGAEWVPGLGVLVILVVAYFAGVAAKNFVGKKLISTANAIIVNIPVLNKIYLAIQQLVDTATLSKKGLFDRAVMIEFPRPGSFGIGFVTSENHKDISAKTGQKMVSVFLPTTPNPTSGFLLYVPENECIDLNLPVEAAIKLIVSGGILTSDDLKRQPAPAPISIKEWAGLFKRKRQATLP
jgi:uncharacterized membrane protein